MPKFKPLPPLERLNELLEVVEIPPDKYGVWSGLVWKVSRGRQRAGSVAGHPQPCDTNPDRIDWQVGVDGVGYLASRVIYFMVYREDPGDATVDHEDQNWLNNNAGNLRLPANDSVQKINSPMQRNNVSGAVGVSRAKGGRKWQAHVRRKGEHIYLGYFTCKIEAAHTVNEEWRRLGWLELGRKLNNLETIECGCNNCVNAP